MLDPPSVEKWNSHCLVLYTCTYGGKTRVTVFCDRASVKIKAEKQKRSPDIRRGFFYLCGNSLRHC